MNVLSFFDPSAADVEAPDLDDVRSVTEDMWMALLGEGEALVTRPVPAGSPFDAAGAWSAAVTVTGGWQGVVTLELDEAIAREVTARMLAIPSVHDVHDGDVADAVGELVNMVGGSIKSLMPGPSTLSLPSVAAGRAAFASDVREVCRVDVAWHDGPVRVCVHVPGA
ncbi:chemotaxis protein CheX [Nocardioides sp. WS12]|uniref:chemotaxis protein CheX n=1 Tax=Nocardioides sp. WS12 TaxID=2486272 RepID=UPI0015FAD500|nr:chemotaxis protein CheX [Nocardioides sp. WS12]